MNTPKLLGISGSLRRNSFSTAILETIRESLKSIATTALHPLDGVPLYNQDEDDDAPPGDVAALRRAIARCDGLVIVTPEYNHGVSGVLKNALDWASRPHGRSVLIGKPVLTMTCSPAFTGGVRAHAQLNETLLATRSRLILRPATVIGLVHEKVTEGRLVDPTALGFAMAAVEDLLREIRGMSGAQSASAEPET